jgi:phage tail sheath gpL-like
MAISFDNIPATIRVPGVYSEIDNSQAVSGPQLIPYRRLLIGQKLSAGTATANQLVRVTSIPEGKTLAGAGSQLAGMIEAALTQDAFTELWILPVADNGAGVQATGSIAITGSATASGTLNLLIAGREVEVAVTSGDSATAIGDAIEAAITADTDLPVTAVNTTGTVAITARHKGECGNEITLMVNFYDGEETPAGVGVAITDMASGATNPDLSTAIAAIGDEWFHIWAIGWTDTATLTDIETELADRFGPLRELEGHAFAAANDTLSNLGTLGNARNSPHLTIVESADNPMPAYEKAAETASIAAYYAQIDPARPIQNLPYRWCIAPKMANRFTMAERNILLYDGIATTKVDAGGTMQVERLITTYKENSAGASDTSYLDVETLLTLMFIRHDWRDYVKRKYPRHKLASDGTRYGPGQAIVTPSLMKAEYVSKAREWEEIGLVENIDAMKENLVSERNASDPNRLDMLLPPDLVNALRVVANKIAFRL